MRTRDQRYAASAYEHVFSISEDKERKSYGALSHKLPILIHTAGLAQALTFVEARGNKLQQKLLNHLAQTVGKADSKALLESARNAHLREYMLLTQQVLDALLWYKRFAQSILDVDEGDGLDG